MNIFEMSDEEFNKYLDNKFKNVTSEEVLDKLIKCGLRTLTDYKFKELGYLIDDESNDEVLYYENEKLNILLGFYLKNKAIKIAKWDVINEEYIPATLPLEVFMLIYKKSEELGWINNNEDFI